MKIRNYSGITLKVRVGYEKADGDEEEFYLKHESSSKKINPSYDLIVVENSILFSDEKG